MGYIVREPVQYAARRVGLVDWLTGDAAAELLRQVEEVPYAPQGRAVLIISYPEQGIEVRAEAEAAKVETVLHGMYRIKGS